jgi:hypothetical protein
MNELYNNLFLSKYKNYEHCYNKLSYYMNDINNTNNINNTINYDTNNNDINNTNNNEITYTKEQKYNIIKKNMQYIFFCKKIYI